MCWTFATQKYDSYLSVLIMLRMNYKSCRAAVCHSYCKYLIRFLVLTDGRNIVYLRLLSTITPNHSDNNPEGFKLRMDECVFISNIFFNDPFGLQPCCYVSYFFSFFLFKIMQQILLTSASPDWDLSHSAVTAERLARVSCIRKDEDSFLN